MIDETKEISFTNIEGRSSKVDILHERKIGEGSYGVVYEADVAIGSRVRRFVIKRFEVTDIGSKSTTATENAMSAMENYWFAKKAGLKVFTTYRLGENRTSILMTSGNTESTICIGTDPEARLPARGLPKIIMTEEQFNKLADAVFDQALFAAERGFSLHGDAFFFLYNKDTNEVDFVLGDLDHVIKGSSEYQPGIFKYRDIYAAEAALGYFVRGNIEKPQKFMQTINAKLSQIFRI